MNLDLSIERPDVFKSLRHKSPTKKIFQLGVKIPVNRWYMGSLHRVEMMPIWNNHHFFISEYTTSYGKVKKGPIKMLIHLPSARVVALEKLNILKKIAEELSKIEWVSFNWDKLPINLKEYMEAEVAIRIPERK